MAKATKALTNLQKDVWKYVQEHGPFKQVNWSTIWTQIDHKRMKKYSAAKIRAAAVAMNAMTPCRMKMAQATQNYGTGLQAM